MSNNINEELKRAVYDENLEEVKVLLSSGADVSLILESTYPWSVDKGNTLLHSTNSAEIVKVLLLGGAEVNARNVSGETQLHWAVKNEQKLEKITELLKHGACIKAKRARGLTALFLAVDSENLEVVKELLKYGADINLDRGRTNDFTCLNYALFRAFSHDEARNLECVKLLIKFTLLRHFDKDYRKIIDITSYSYCTFYIKLTAYIDDCVCEVSQMKTDEIRDGFPLYELVTNNFNNKRLSARLEKMDFSVFCIRYPIYNDIIVDKMKSFLERADLLNRLSQIQFYTKLDTANPDFNGKNIILDYDSTYNITKYLPNEDLLNFITAFEDSNKGANEASISTMSNDQD